MDKVEANNKVKIVLLRTEVLIVFKISHSERKAKKIGIGQKISASGLTPLTVERTAKIICG
jgi:hypothetical protein